MTKRWTMTAAALLGLAGCATPSVQRIPFPESEYAALAKAGTGTVNGQAYLKSSHGEVQQAAVEKVYLDPVTSYSWQWLMVTYAGGRELAPADPRLSGYVQQTVADADGRFTFQRVPPGEYFVISKIVWQVPTGYGMIPQGGFVVGRVVVRDGEVADVTVTRP